VQQYAEFVQMLAQFEPVHILAAAGPVMDQAVEMVGSVGQVAWHDIPTNDAWIRDYGPTFLLGPDNDETFAVDWEFNSWGGKYPPWNSDNAVPRQLAQELSLRVFHPGIVLEGGSIDGNGSGRLLTSHSCLLDPRRNTRVGRPEMERFLQQYCCATEILWLNGPTMAGDDTDGHIDQLARFVSPHQVVVAVEDDPTDENHGPLQANLATLRRINDRLAEPLDLIPLPMPRPIVIDAQRVPASYCNFYIANQCVLLPRFDDPADEIACAILEPLFPDRQIISQPARELIFGLGAFHCLTQQQPAAGAPYTSRNSSTASRMTEPSGSIPVQIRKFKMA
jgi:agmatine deiminase